jgi:hypothetical protein
VTIIEISRNLLRLGGAEGTCAHSITPEVANKHIDTNKTSTQKYFTDKIYKNLHSVPAAITDGGAYQVNFGVQDILLELVHLQQQCQHLQ